MVVAFLLVMALAGFAGALVWSGMGRHIGLGEGFQPSPQAIELLHTSVAAVPANSFDARLRITRR